MRTVADRKLRLYRDFRLQAPPPPMFAGNEASADAVCLKGEAFRSAAVRAKARWPIVPLLRL